jgi:signal transduction histidine kinase
MSLREITNLTGIYARFVKLQAKGSLRSHLFLIVVFFFFIAPRIVLANSSDSLKSVFYQSKNADKRLEIAFQFGSQNLSNPKECFPIVIAALRDSSSATNNFFVAKSLRLLGTLYYYQAVNDSALFYYQKALIYFGKTGDTKEITKTLKNIGLVYSNKGDYQKAIEYYIKTLSYFESQKDTNNIIANLNDLGNAFTLSGNSEKGLDCQRKALSWLSKFPLPAVKGNVLNSIGYIYEDLNQMDSAIYYYDQSLILKEKYSTIFSQLNTRNNLCDCYFALNKSEKSIRCFEELIPLQRKVGDNEGIIRSYINMANGYGKLKNFKRSIDLLNEVKPLIDSIGTLRNKMDFYSNLEIVQAGSGNYKSAYKSQNFYQTFKDSLFNEDKNRQLLDISTKYEVEKKNRQLLENAEQLALAHNEALLSQLSIRKRNFWLTVLGGVLILVILSARLIIMRQRSKAELEKSNAVISERDRGTLAIIDAQEEERTRIAKELHDGVGNQLLALHLKWNNAIDQMSENDGLKEELRSGSKLLKEAMNEVRSVSHQMMPKVLSEFGLIPAIEEMLDRSLTPASIKHQFDSHIEEKNFDKKMEVAIYRILQELITNVIKHSNAAEVQVQLFSNQGYLILILEDNGKGLPADGKASNGIGLTSIQSRLHTINGEFSITPGPYTGTLVTIRIPIKYEH